MGLAPDSDIAAGFVHLGADALHLCQAVAERMATDPALRERVNARHARMAHAYAEDHPEASLEMARQAGRRAYLIVLLIEASQRGSNDHCCG